MIWLHFICIMVVWSGNDNEKTMKRAKVKKGKRKMRNKMTPKRANLEWNEIPRVKDSKVYHRKTPNGKYIWVRTRIIQWKPNNDSALRVSTCIMIAFTKRICIIYQVYTWIYYSRLKWLIYFEILELLICYTYDWIRKMIILIGLNLYGWGFF